jgi:hypothetical protein
VLAAMATASMSRPNEVAGQARQGQAGRGQGIVPGQWLSVSPVGGYGTILMRTWPLLISDLNHSKCTFVSLIECKLFCKYGEGSILNDDLSSTLS